MPRPKTIIVNDPDVLAAVTAAWQADRDQAAEAAANSAAEYEAGGETGRYDRWVNCCAFKRELDALDRDGVRYDLARFAGRQLSASERIRWQESIRRLEAAGKVVRHGNSIRPRPEAANA
jgi:hypothetical protein